MDFREFVLSTWNCCTMVGIAKYVAMWVAFKPCFFNTAFISDRQESLAA